MSDSYLTVPTLIRGRFRRVRDAEAPRIYRGAPPSPTAAIREELLAGSRQSELQIRFLAEMDRKLDAVLTLLQRDSLARDFPEEGHIVALSGHGLVMECNNDLPVGSYAELLILLEEYPMRIVSTLSRVEGSRAAGVLPDMHGHACDMTYAAIAEEDRDAVIRFVFSEERKRIRQSKGEV